MPDPNVIVTFTDPPPPVDPDHNHPFPNAVQYSTPALTGEGEFVNNCTRDIDAFWWCQGGTGVLLGKVSCTPPGGKGSVTNLGFFNWQNMTSQQQIWVGASWKGHFATPEAYFAAHPIGQGGHHSSPIIIT